MVNIGIRQYQWLRFIKEVGKVKKRQVSEFLSVSEDTALRELNAFIKASLVKRMGVGKATVYMIHDRKSK